MSAIATLLARDGPPRERARSGRRHAVPRRAPRPRRRRSRTGAPGPAARHRRRRGVHRHARRPPARRWRRAPAGLPVVHRAAALAAICRRRDAPSRSPAPTGRPPPRRSSPPCSAAAGVEPGLRRRRRGRGPRSQRGVGRPGPARRRGRRERRHLPRARRRRPRSSPTSSPTTSSTGAARPELRAAFERFVARAARAGGAVRRRSGSLALAAHAAQPRHLRHRGRRRLPDQRRRHRGHRGALHARRTPVSAVPVAVPAAPGVHNARNAAAAVALAHTPRRRPRRRRPRPRRASGGWPAASRCAARRPGWCWWTATTTCPPRWPPRWRPPGRATGTGWCAASSPTATAAPRRSGRTFADCFADADLLVVTGIYPAGEAPRPGVTGKIVADAVLDAHPWKRVAWLPDPRRRGRLPRRHAARRRPLPHPRRRRPHHGPAAGARRALEGRGAMSEPSGDRGDRRAARRPGRARTRPSARSPPIGSAGRPRCWPASTTTTTSRAVADAVAATGIDVVVVGKGSNLLVADAGFPGLGARARATPSPSIEVDGTEVVAGAAAALPVVARRTVAAGLTGFEWAVGVPGSIGGAVRMNAGGHGSDMAAVLARVRVVDLRSGEDGWVPASQLDLGYRRSAVLPHHLVLAARLRLAPGDVERGTAELAEIVAWRRANQPGGPERRVGVHQPARRLRRPAHRRGRRQGPAPRHRRGVHQARQLHPGRRGRPGRRRRRADGGAPGARPRATPAWSSTPRPGWSASTPGPTLDLRSRVDDGGLRPTAADPPPRPHRPADPGPPDRGPAGHGSAPAAAARRRRRSSRPWRPGSCWPCGPRCSTSTRSRSRGNERTPTEAIVAAAGHRPRRPAHRRRPARRRRGGHRAAVGAAGPSSTGGSTAPWWSTSPSASPSPWSARARKPCSWTPKGRALGPAFGDPSHSAALVAIDGIGDGLEPGEFLGDEAADALAVAASLARARSIWGSGSPSPTAGSPASSTRASRSCSATPASSRPRSGRCAPSSSRSISPAPPRSTCVRPGARC